MCKTILEIEINTSDIIAAPVNHARRWYRYLHFIAENENLNHDVKISFCTVDGNRVVNTRIIAIIENYVKIENGIIIPLSSITRVYLKESVVEIKDNDEHYWRIVFIVLLVLVSILVIFYVLKA